MASAGHAAVDRRTPASGASPFPPVCNTQPQSGTLYVGSEVEPWIDVDPSSAGDADGPNLIGVYQQDRYSSGGARGLGASVSTNGGQSHTALTAGQLPRFSQCAGNPLYERAVGSVGELLADGHRPSDLAVLQRHREPRHIGVTYYDFRNNNPATPELETDTWFTRSTDGGRTWSEERVTPTSFDMRTAPVARGLFTGDYEGLTALDGDFWSLVSESRGSTDTWSGRLTSPFAGPSYTPSGNENNSPPAKAFPVAKGRPAPA